MRQAVVSFITELIQISRNIVQMQTNAELDEQRIKRLEIQRKAAKDNSNALIAQHHVSAAV